MASENYSIGVRLQKMSFAEQILVLARIAQARSKENQFSPKQIEELFIDLPKPAKISNEFAKLKRDKFLTHGNQKGTWRMTPLGKQTSFDYLSDLDLAAFNAESSASSSILGEVLHTVVSPALAPPELISGLRQFLEKHPFETNVFGMTRFPEADESKKGPDPVKPALIIAKEVCLLHGLQFHLASDRNIVDDLWKNVMAHMWGCQYGIAFFEDLRDRGLNHNLTIEVGSMLMAGRRCALLKDGSIDKMPTDLVGHIYKSIDFSKPETIRAALHIWLRDDLNLGPCPSCPKK